MPDEITFTSGYALVVGVGCYEQSNLSVPVTAQDAKDLGQTLTAPQYCGYPDSQVTILTGQDANKMRILAELDKLRERIENDKNATLVILFSGHGWQQDDSYYFLPYETKLAKTPGGVRVDPCTALANEEFLSKVRQIRAQRLVILFDTCHAGSVGTSLAPEISRLPQFAPVPLGLYDALLEGSGRVIISSSMASERSWIKPGAAHSLFVEHLLEGLRGKGARSDQNTVRVLDLFVYVSEAVPADAQSIGQTQTPVLKAYDLTRNYPIALLGGSQRRSPNTSLGATAETRYSTASIRRLLTEAFSEGNYSGTARL